MKEASTPAFWSQDIQTWFQKLNSNPTGLTQHAAEYALQQAGNLINKPSHLRQDFLLFIGQFRSPLMLLLIGAVILSAFLGDTSDVLIILGIVLSTSLLSFFQERNAGRVVEELQSLVALKSTVLRDQKEAEILSEQIVPGDVLVLNAGDRIPADCLLIESNELHANEASLTGESFPVRKQPGVLDAATELADRTNCLWEGTSVVSGTAKALVIETGTETIFGTIVEHTNTYTETTFEAGIKSFGLFLVRITLILSVIILAINLLNHKTIVDAALFALALAVGMAPELLPAITTIAMSAGAKRMLKQKVIVKTLNSIQNLGEVNLLCTDKTGTITEGTIILDRIVDGWNTESEFVSALAYYNAFYQTGYANPVDEVLKKINAPVTGSPAKVGEVPYDFTRKRLSVAMNTGTDKWLISKGAVTQILDICSSIRRPDGNVTNIDPEVGSLNAVYEKYGKDGLRVLAVCYKPITNDNVTKEDECEMIFAGFILLQDPVKKGIAEAINKLRQLQVDLKIISGDNKNVSISIGKQIGIASPKVMTGAEMESLTPEALQQQVKSIHIFSEVAPQQKERIIYALRKTYSVAYMGDGINDLSAIHAADIGISVENAADVTREAADFVLLEKNISVLADGIREGRKTFANTLKYIFISTGCTFGNMFSVSIASLILPFLPMLPKQILLTNFLTDFPYLAISSDNVDEEQLNRPGRWDLKLIRRYMLFFGIHSSVFDIITFLTLLFYLKVKESTFQTGWFIESVLTELFILFIIRTHKNFFKSRPGKYLFLFGLIGLILTLSLPYLPFHADFGMVPLDFYQIGILSLIVLLYIITADILKVWFFKTQTAG